METAESSMASSIVEFPVDLEPRPERIAKRVQVANLTLGVHSKIMGKCLADPSLDEIVAATFCPSCDHRIETTLGWLMSNRALVCSACTTVVPYDQEGRQRARESQQPEQLKPRK